MIARRCVHTMYSVLLPGCELFDDVSSYYRIPGDVVYIIAGLCSNRSLMLWATLVMCNYIVSTYVLHVYVITASL